jgi:sec-independent protein translocase protein TatA
MFGNIGPLEIGIVLVIALVVFGPKRLPELGNGLGRGLREFKQTVTGEKGGEDEQEGKEGKAIAAPSSEDAPQSQAGSETNSTTFPSGSRM